MKSPYQEIKGLLMESNMSEGEAKAVALMLLEKVAGLPTAKALIADGNDLLCRRQSLLELAARVAQGEPVQYVLCEADFCGLTMKVKPGVLIPRPETEELVAWVVENVKANSNLLPLTSYLSPFKLLDIGTGSGCIAVALAKKLKEAEVEAWDVSDDALEIARENAKRNGVQVKTSKVDVLDINANSNSQLSTVNFQLSTLTSHLSPLTSYNIIVSNPPYICEEEKAEMERNVLEHEPELALFVPDDDPLLFYRRIAELGLSLLKEKGLLFFEINRRFGEEVVKMLQGKGYREVELRQDMFGNDRMVKAIKPA